MEHGGSLALWRLSMTLAVPLLLLRLLLRSLREPLYRRDLAQRLGFGLPSVAPGGVWVHAVSAGEVAAAAPLLRALHAEQPRLPLLVSVTTPAGRVRARALLGDLPLVLFWLPWDLPGAVERALTRLRPSRLVLMETELWPWLIATCRRRGVPVVLANARMAARSARGYARVPTITRPMLQGLSAILCQTTADAERLRDLGAAPSRLLVAGQLKLEADATAPVPAAFVRCTAGRWTLLAGSTHAPEEALILEALAPLLVERPELLLVIAPRQPRRFDEVAALIAASELRWRRYAATAPEAGSTREPEADAAQVLLLDTMGDLAACFGAARLAFLGGSLVDAGGHNPIEAAARAVPVAVGPCRTHFEAIYARLLAVGGATEVATAPALATLVSTLMAAEADRAERGRRARALVLEGRGALAVTLALVTGAGAPATGQGV